MKNTMPARSTSPLTSQQHHSPQPIRSILSRIRSPFRNSSRSYLEFDIQPEDPHRQYAPGELVKGTVLVRVGKPVRITHLVVSLLGYAQVYKTPNASGEGYRAYIGTKGEAKKKRDGFVMLFEDEVVLCGEGRLDLGIYQFKFELEFPGKGLPSSINFERGTVSYLITSTLTRPTTIAAVTTFDRNVEFIEDIDIGSLSPPKPRIISLEPISRRTRARNARKRAIRIDTNSKPSEENTREELTPNEGGTPRSPTPSDVSFDSHFSSTGTGSARDSVHISVASEGDATSSDKTASASKRVVASVEIGKAGFLRGDSIPIKILVDHVKPIRNLYGIIVTFYRIGRVDSNAHLPPPTPRPRTSDAGRSQSQPTLRHSKSTRGGLSIAPTGSRHSFRKDLSQAFAPLFVDPTTLKAEVQTRVQVPAEAFPTIASVPSGMICFKYYVEVIVDLQGKLTGLDRVLANAGMIGAPTTYTQETPHPGAGEEASGSYFTAWGNNFIDTDELRRDKNIATCIFEVTVGTRDSERRRGKQRDDSGLAMSRPQLERIQSIGRIVEGDGNDPLGQYGTSNGYDIPGDLATVNNYPHAPPPLPSTPGQFSASAPQTPTNSSTFRPGIPSSPPPPVPPLHHPPESASDEKSRLRQAEAALMPSAPPDLSGPSVAHAPSAPQMDDDPAHLLAAPEIGPDFSAAFGGLSGPSASSASAVDGSRALASARDTEETVPRYEPSTSAAVAAGDDKQELHRRRLEEERSAPFAPDDYEHEAPDSQPSGPPGNFGETEEGEPSAPTEDEILGLHIAGPAEGDTQLPRYER